MFYALLKRLTDGRDRMAALLRRLVSLGEPDRLPSVLFPKFLHLMEHVAVEEEKERRLLARIDAIEAEHRFRREQKTLRIAGAANPPLPVPANDLHEMPKPKRGLWMLLLACVLMSSNKNKP